MEIVYLWVGNLRRSYLKTAIVLQTTLSGALTVAHIKPLSSLGNKTINFFYRVSVFPSCSFSLSLCLSPSSCVKLHTIPFWISYEIDSEKQLNPGQHYNFTATFERRILTEYYFRHQPTHSINTAIVIEPSGHYRIYPSPSPSQMPPGALMQSLLSLYSGSPTRNTNHKWNPIATLEYTKCNTEDKTCHGEYKGRTLGHLFQAILTQMSNILNCTRLQVPPSCSTPRLIKRWQFQREEHVCH